MATSRAVTPQVKVKTVNIGGKNIDPKDLGRVMGAKVTASVQRGVSKIRTPMRDMLLRVYEDLQRKHSVPWSNSSLFGSYHDTRLHRRTGRGLQSIKDSIHVSYVGDGQGVVGSITAGELAIHESGKRIRPTSGRYLAIPTTYATDSAGRPLRSSAYGWPNSFIRRSKGGKSLFVFQRLRGGRIRPLYLLKRQVYIPPRLRLRETLRRHAATFDRDVAAVIRREFA